MSICIHLQSATRRGTGIWGLGDEDGKLLSKGTHAYPHQKSSGSETDLTGQELSELSQKIGSFSSQKICYFS
ncbi:hypothetical protein [Kamptonema formosum]|uniref:hypothetical protein n=1 Tax=Kamptonema formosum TaxID=331992 RepID=UPI000346C7AE|nr:hypothetical protein [Oscillatoria sp. PCC 10802]